MPHEQSKKAAQYVRMSTDMQRYSTENQKSLIALYAASHGFQIVKTYADEGKSGLSIKGRAGLQQLLQDVRGGNAGFGTVLVYDVSRWGRFQDADESAYYEFLCRESGIAIRYCAEEFANVAKSNTGAVKIRAQAMMFMAKILDEQKKHDEAINNYIKIATFFESERELAAEGLWRGAQLMEDQASGKIAPPKPATLIV